MNILRAGDKSPMQKGLFKTGIVDLLPVLRFLGRLYNFLNFIIIFSLMQVTMIRRRATHFTDSETIKYYQKTCS